MKNKSSLILNIVGILSMAGIFLGCKPGGPTSVATGDAAEKVYVAPGKYDEFYNFVSGGFSGQMSVYGIPSGRLFRIIPTFSQDPTTGYGYSERQRQC